jgi:hypothetical protein
VTLLTERRDVVIAADDLFLTGPGEMAGWSQRGR